MSKVLLVGTNKSGFIDGCAKAGGVGLATIVDSLDEADVMLLVVDIKEGMTVEDETVLRQGLKAGTQAVLFLDNLDKALATMDAEDVYRQCCRAVDMVNVVLCTGGGRTEAECMEWDQKFGQTLGDIQVYPEQIKGTVAFGSASQGWGFTVRHFSKMYAKKFGVDEAKMTQRLWGDSYFYADKKVWTNRDQPDGCARPLRRAACQFMFDSIKQMSQAVLDNNSRVYEKMFKATNISLSSSDRALSGQDLLAQVMQQWMAGDYLNLLLFPLKQRVSKSFDQFDKNGDGRISRSEVSALMKQLDSSWSGGDLDKLMARADTNRDGTMDPEEFVQFVFSPSR